MKFIRVLPGCLVAAVVFTAGIGAARADFSVTFSGGPQHGQSGVPVDAWIDREFSAPVDNSTVIVGNILLKTNVPNAQGGTPTDSNLCTSIGISAGRRITCNHASLVADQWYTFTITQRVTSSTGVVLTATGTYAFQTANFGGFGGGENVVPPGVASTVPRTGASFPVNGLIRIVFDPGGTGTGATMATTTGQKFANGSVLNPTNVRLYAASNGQPTGSNLLVCNAIGANAAAPTSCNMSWNNATKELIISPGRRSPSTSLASTGGTLLVAGSKYILQIGGAMFGPSGPIGEGAAVRNTDGQPIMGGDYRVEFTAAAEDSTRPDVSATAPGPNAININRAIYDISVGFTEPIDSSTITDSNITMWCEDGDGSGCDGNGTAGLDASDTRVIGISVAYDSSTQNAIVSPNAVLVSEKVYYVQVGTGVKDLAGNGLDDNSAVGGQQAHVLAFTTGTSVNGQASDTTSPEISFANANTFEVAITFTEPMKFNRVANMSGSASTGPTDVNNPRNWSLESPPGVPVNLATKSFTYEPAQKTLMIGGLSFPPDQSFRVKARTQTGAAYMQDISGNAIVSHSGAVMNGTVRSAFDTGGDLGPGGRTGEGDFFSFGHGVPAQGARGRDNELRNRIPDGERPRDGGYDRPFVPDGVFVRRGQQRVGVPRFRDDRHRQQGSERPRIGCVGNHAYRLQ